MHRRIPGLIIICTAVLLAGVFVRDTAAQSEPPMTEAQIEHIRRNCTSSQSTLSQIHASDALLRVNRGQLYGLISTKLMAPLNSRIALNRLGGPKLPATTLEYNRKLNSFRSDYQQYEEVMSRTLEISCSNQPVAFYDSLKEARIKRQAVHADVDALNVLLQTYKANFEEFAAGLPEETR